MWQCPKCKCQEVSVEVKTMAILTQDHNNFETEIYGDHEWDENSIMCCSKCSYSAKSKKFEKTS